MTTSHITGGRHKPSQVVAMDSLQTKLLSSQVEHHARNAALGWCGMVVALGDLVGNIVGVPVITGFFLAFANSESFVAPFVYLSWLIQIVLIFSSVYAIWNSAWKFWLPTCLNSDERQAGLLAYFLSDTASILGVVLGFIACIMLVLVHLQGDVAPLGNVWRNDCLELFWKSQAIFLVLIAAAVSVLLYGNSVFAPDRWLINVSEEDDKPYHPIDIRKEPTWPVIGHLEHASLKTRMVWPLIETPNGEYRVLRYTDEVAFNHQLVHLIVLDSLAQRIGDLPSTLNDKGGDLFALQVSFQLNPQNIDEVQQSLRLIDYRIPQRIVSAFLGLLVNTRNPREILNQTVEDALNDHFGGLETLNARNVFDGLSKSILRIAAKGIQPMPAQTTRTPQLGELIVRPESDPYDRLRPMLSEVEAFHETHARVWGKYREKKSTAAGTVPKVFQQRLFTRLFGDKCQGHDYHAGKLLLDAVGLSLRVDRCDFAEGESQDVDALLSKVHGDFEARRTQAETRGVEYESNFVTLAHELERAAQSNKFEFSRMLMDRLPEFFRLGQHYPDLMQTFVDRFGLDDEVAKTLRAPRNNETWLPSFD